MDPVPRGTARAWVWKLYIPNLWLSSNKSGEQRRRVIDCARKRDRIYEELLNNCGNQFR